MAVTFKVSVNVIPSALQLSETLPVWNPSGTVPEMVKVFALASYLQSLSWMNQVFHVCLVGWLFTPETVTVAMALPWVTVCVRAPEMVPLLPLLLSTGLEEELTAGCSTFWEEEETLGLGCWLFAELELAVIGFVVTELLEAVIGVVVEPLEFAVDGSYTTAPSTVLMDPSG